MELNHLRYFYEVARQGSFTGASRALRVSQPSISKAVRLLEERQGVRLFDRSRRGVALTETGRDFLEGCRSIFSEVERLRSAIESRRTECEGDLAVGASDNLCNYVLPGLLARFVALHPKVRVKLFSGTARSIQADILEGRSEIGLFYSQVSDRSFVPERLGFVEFAIVASPDHPLLRGVPERRSTMRHLRQALSRAVYVGSRIEDYVSATPCSRMLQAAGVRPTRVFEITSQETQKRLAMEGLGYTVVPRFIVERELAEGTLRAIRPPAPIGWDLYLVKRRNRTLSTPARAFERHVVERWRDP